KALKHFYQKYAGSNTWFKWLVWRFPKLAEGLIYLYAGWVIAWEDEQQDIEDRPLDFLREDHGDYSKHLVLKVIQILIRLGGIAFIRLAMVSMPLILGAIPVILGYQAFDLSSGLGLVGMVLGAPFGMTLAIHTHK